MSIHLRYLSYVVRHKWFVFQAGLKTGAPLWRLVVHDWSKFLPSEWIPYARFFYGKPTEPALSPGDPVRLYSLEGWSGPATIIERMSDTRYRVNAPAIWPHAPEAIVWYNEITVLQDYYAVLEENKAAFDAAWLLHQNRNPHHWNFWVLTEDNGGTRPLPMPYHFVREMVADWAGAGRAITGQWEVPEWYEKNKDKMTLHPATRNLVEKLLHDCFLQREF